MSVSYRMTISEELAQLVEQRRGVLTVQEFTLLALLDACQGSRVEHELRQQVRELQHLLGRVTTPPSELPEARDEQGGGRGRASPGGDMACDDRLGWG
jgi:hypothetical protein